MPSAISDADALAVETPADAVPRRRRLRAVFTGRPHAWGVGAVTIVTAVLYCAYLFIRYERLDYGLLDLGIYDQALRGWAHFHLPYSPVVALPNADSPGMSQLSDHFTPILALLAPLYWIKDSPVVLLFAGGVLMALAIPPVWLFTRRALGVPAAYCVALALAVAWPIQNALWFGFHEVSFAVPITAWMLERAGAGKRRQAAAVSLLLLLVKDDMGFVVAAFGVALLFWNGPRDAWRRIRAGAGRRAPFRARIPLLGTAAMLAAGVAMVELVTKDFIPAAGGSPDRNWSYTSIAATPGALLHWILAHPLTAAHRLVAPDIKFNTLMWLFAPLLFLPLLSPIALLAIPLLVERMLSDNTMYWSLGLHYNAFLVVILLLAGVDGAARLGRWTSGYRLGRARFATLRGFPTLGTAWAAVVAIVALWALPRWPMWTMTDSAWWQSTNTYELKAARAAADHVPDGVLVASAAEVGPLLLDRTKVFIWSHPGDRTPVGEPPWILADVQRIASPWQSVAEQQARVAELRRGGYQVVYEGDGFVVLHRP